MRLAAPSLLAAPGAVRRSEHLDHPVDLAPGQESGRRGSGLLRESEPLIEPLRAVIVDRNVECDPDASGGSSSL